MGEPMQSGCDECRKGVLSGMYSPDVAAWQGNEVSPPTFVYRSIQANADLYRCDRCGSWWQFNVREAHVVSEREAEIVFADYFRPIS